ncbi:CubicO group peptidase (beta-lactamase class C family) [Paenibacillus rhizosphaerae]|uniref:CubicO group peptidase (Beta-lactamase class C family) n=1 Tax=Paenibacillus rhizosphaerae TaxID=297318 RepID=A0A839TL32_9BACL|nr:serine hydrolase domain-containing protein [Paenibacillus rhizosphaerae]MBB3126440.1 CubicO group peptidase (beta-lactamase class C family) [Paenibacillus rhizosphaerae]
MNLDRMPDQAAFEPLDEVVRKARTDYGASASSVLVIHNDRIVYEQYRGFHHHKEGAVPVTESSLFNIYSTRKTYICCAMAMTALDNGVPISTPVAEVLGNYPGEDLGQLTLRDLVTVSGPKYFHNKQWEREGIQGQVVRALSGKSIGAFLEERILEPLTCKETIWATAPTAGLVCDYATNPSYATVRLESHEGHERNMYTSTRDLAKWGYLHLKRGNVGGHQLIPAAFYRLSDELKTKTPDRRILGWYHRPEWFYATGAAGCHVVVFPEHQAVGVRMLNKYTSRYEDDQYLFDNALLKCLQQAGTAGVL